MENAKPNMRALAQACEALSLPYKAVDEYGDFLAVTINGADRYFVNTRTPLNDEGVGEVCVNKVYTYMLLKDELPMPETRSYIDPSVDGMLLKYVNHGSVKEIVADIEHAFTFPVILKMNAGSQGKHVYKCDSLRKVARSIKSVFNKKQRNYDFSVLAQAYIDVAHEYRVLLLDGEIVLLYEKVVAEKGKNLSPLHNEGGKAVVITDESIHQSVKTIIEGSPHLKQMRWIGLDVAQDAEGKWWILELNTHPGFSYFIRDNGEAALVPVYIKMLQKLQHEK